MKNAIHVRFTWEDGGDSNPLLQLQVAMTMVDEVLSKPEPTADEVNNAIAVLDAAIQKLAAEMTRQGLVMERRSSKRES